MGAHRKKLHDSFIGFLLVQYHESRIRAPSSQVPETLAERYFETALVDNENGVPPPERRSEHELPEGQRAD
jgi:hypothetical protein